MRLIREMKEMQNHFFDSKEAKTPPVLNQQCGSLPFVKIISKASKIWFINFFILWIHYPSKYFMKVVDIVTWWFSEFSNQNLFSEDHWWIFMENDLFNVKINTFL